MPRFCSYHILTSSVIYYCTDARQLVIYFLMSEPLIEKHATSTGLSNVNREKHTRKSHRVCRRDREASRIPIRSLKG